MNIRKKAKKNFFTSFFAFQLTDSCSGTHIMLFFYLSAKVAEQ